MSGPLIFISHSTVKPGKREQYQGHAREATDLVESEEPRMIGFNSYASPDGTDVSTVQIHPDAESLDTHLKIFAEKLQARAFDALDSSDVSVYGTPSEAARAMLDGMAAQTGIRVRVLPVHEGGFLRPQPL
ncbi:MAG TPA: hypothetical protein VK925_06015 [Jiangellaceae bacterium]|nr:hypothetical protein [Jiangellaceae bacterium]